MPDVEETGSSTAVDTTPGVTTGAVPPKNANSTRTLPVFDNPATAAVAAAARRRSAASIETRLVYDET